MNNKYNKDDFGVQELRDLFRVEQAELERSATCAQLAALHSSERFASDGLHAHLRFLESAPCFTGI